MEAGEVSRCHLVLEGFRLEYFLRLTSIQQTQDLRQVYFSLFYDSQITAVQFESVVLVIFRVLTV